MNTLPFKQSSEDYLRIEQAILYLENHYQRPAQPGRGGGQYRVERISIFSDCSPAGPGSARNASCNS
jgi:hypothetical protein